MAMNDMQAKISALLEAGTGPDIFQLNWNWAYLYDAKLRDVSAIAEKQGKDGGGYIDLAPALCKVASGQWKAVPFGVLGAAVMHRADWLKEAGVSKWPETWEELNSVGKQVKAKKGKPAQKK
jgi:ABC-type glycerol-3-phosphate transport system substrate-binding protein